MAELLRTIRKSRWYSPEDQWLPAGQVPADAITDLPTKSNQLSVWFIDDDRSNLNAVLVACASTRDNLQVLDYALLDHRYFATLGIEIVDSPGQTPYSEANHWHRNLVRLSGQRLLAFGQMVFDSGDRCRIQEIGLVRLIKEAVDRGAVQLESLRENVQRRVRREED